MKLTPLDIKKQEFTKVIRGFDPVEVQSFLDMVAEEFEGLVKSIEDLRVSNKKLKKQLDEYQEIEKTLKSTLMEAQQSTDKTRKNIEKEADLLIKESEITAQQIIDNARKEENRIRNEIYLLKNQRESLVLRLKQLLRSQLELIKVLEIEDVQFKKSKPDIEKKTEEESHESEVELINIEDENPDSPSEKIEKEKTESEIRIIDPLADEEIIEEIKTLPKIEDDSSIIDKMILEEDDETDEDK